jgi:thioredoxin
MAPITVTDRTFTDIVEKSGTPVLVDFWAPWCGPCLSLAPVIEQIAFDVGDRVTVAKLNPDENPTTAGRFQIRSIPTLIVFNGGREVDRIVGAQPRGQILSRLQKYLN